MSSEYDFNLDYNSSIILKKIKGNKVIEFKRHNDPVLDNIVEMFKYDSKKKKRDKPDWIILKDLPSFISSYLNSGEYEIENSGTKDSKNNKKL